MEFPRIALKLKETQFSKIHDLAVTVSDHLYQNIYFPSPTPSRQELNDGILELNHDLGKWGPKGNRGSHADYERLQFTSRKVFGLLRSLAKNCEITVMSNLPRGEWASVMATSGFPLRRQKAPQGRLEKVQNLHILFAPYLNRDEIKIDWERPLNVRTHTNVSGYAVYRNNVPDFTTATYLKQVTKTTITDKPGNGQWYYWVVSINYMGKGAVSEMLSVMTY